MNQCNEFFGVIDPLGVLMLSVNSWTSLGGLVVNRETEIATTKLINIPKVPIPSGEIPTKNHLECQCLQAEV